MKLCKYLYVSFFISLYVFVTPSMCIPRRRKKGKEDPEPLQRAVTLTKPLVPMEFWEKAKRKPRRKHLKTNSLLRKMGEDFDPSWMSAKEPEGNLESVVEISDDQVAELVEQIADLNLNQDLLNLLPNFSSNADEEEEEGENAILPSDVKKISHLLQKWLIKKSSCPVTYKWTDLGEYFWPRWIRKGSCHQEKNGFLDKKPDCSWPKGLQCVPGEALTLQILRWHCKRRRPHFGHSHRNRPMKCKWYKVPYPITSSCKCDCKSKKTR